MTLSNADVFWARIEQENAGTGNFSPYLTTAPQSVPDGIRNTAQPAQGDLTLPVLTPSSNQRYRLVLFVSTTADGSGSGTGGRPATFAPVPSVTNSNPVVFNGWSAASLEPILLRFNSDSLTVSAKTKGVATLTAGWQTEGQASPVGVQFQNNHQDPVVNLKYADLGEVKGLPSISIKLQDANGIPQESILTISVNITSQVKSAKDAAKAQPTKAKFSWSDLAKTGIAGLLTYFGAAL